MDVTKLAGPYGVTTPLILIYPKPAESNSHLSTLSLSLSLSLKTHCNVICYLRYVFEEVTSL
jgi:hypothetical protein